MASAIDEYNKLAQKAREQLHTNGKIDPKLMHDKGQAGAAAREEQRRINRQGKRGAQEVYLSRFPDSEKPVVKERLAAAAQGKKTAPMPVAAAKD